MRVGVYPADDGGCGWYRLRYPAQVLADQGADVYVGRMLRIRDYRVQADADVIVLQRPLSADRLSIIAQARAAGIRVVVEVDDDFHAIPAGHPARVDFSPLRHPERNWRILAQACDMADLVTVSTPALAERYGRHGRVQVLPNYVPGWYLDVAQVHHEVPVIGWTGSPHSHVGDLDVTGGAVGDVLAATGARFEAIGSPRTLDELGIDGDVSPWAPLTDRGPTGYARTVARLDVGLVPLQPHAFNEAKSWLKGIEYAALGVPFVASPTTEYRRLARLGVGTIAETPAEWRRHLEALARSADMRVEHAAFGREAAAALTYERHAERWWNAWGSVVGAIAA